MKSSPRGFALVISNVTFDPCAAPDLDPRKGGEVDDEVLRKVFTELDYVVTVHRDLTAQVTNTDAVSICIYRMLFETQTIHFIWLRSLEKGSCKKKRNNFCESHLAGVCRKKNCLAGLFSSAPVLSVAVLSQSKHTLHLSHLAYFKKLGMSKHVG